MRCGVRAWDGEFACARGMSGWLCRRGAQAHTPGCVARAGQWRVLTALYFALLGCERLFGISAPAGVLSRLRSLGPRAAALRWLVFHRETDQLRRLEHLIALLLVDRGRDLMRPLKAVLFPSPAWLQARYGGAGSSLLTHYLAHARRMAAVTRAAKEALGHGRPVAPNGR